MNRLRVLMFHKISENTKDFLTVTPEQLKEQLFWLKERYHFITLRELIAHIEAGSHLPDKSILVTFDDGYENNYTLAYPIFKALNLPFCIFLVSSFIGKKVNHDNKSQKFMSIEQLHHMQDLVQYGFHSRSHRNLNDLPEEDWEEEIHKGVETLKAFPIPVENAWAYTYGAYPKKNPSQMEHLQSIFKKNNIRCAFRIGNRTNRLPLTKPYTIQRIDVRGNEHFLKFRLKVRFGKVL